MMNLRTSFVFALLLIGYGKIIAQQDSILYHDMQMESQWGSTTVNDLFGCFVRFTPPAYPAQLTGIRAYFRNTGNPSTIKWKVYTDPSGSGNGGLNVAYLSPAPSPNPAAGGAPNQDYTGYVDLTSQNIIINSGDVYAGVVQNTGFFGIGIDNLPANNVAPTRQWQWMNVFGTDYWNTLVSQAATGQFGITAFFQPFGTSLPETESGIQIIYQPGDRTIDVILSKTTQDAKLRIYDMSGRLTTSSGCSETHCTLNLAGCTPGIYTLVLNSGTGVVTRKFGVY
jgi:hypothetical protein